MARIINQLTDLSVRAKTKPGLYHDGGGCYLQVKPGIPDVVKSWLYRFRSPVTGKVRDMGLGAFPLVSLKDARRKAQDAAKVRDSGKDPIAERDAVRAAHAAVLAIKSKTLEGCCEGYANAKSAGWGESHTRVWRNSIRDHVPVEIGRKPVADIDTAAVMQILEPIWLTKHETARRLRARIEAVLGWAKTGGYRSGDNPAVWKDHLANLLPKSSDVHTVEHHPALPYREIGPFMAELRDRDDDRDSLCLELLILTATRLDAAANARAEEFNMDEKIWTVPPERMKRRGKRKGMSFRLPLSAAAIAVVRRTGITTGLLFPGATDNSLADAHGRDDITTHGFRSTFRDWAGERTNFPREVIEMALAHAIADETEEAYARGDLFDKRRRLMDAWAGYCGKSAVSADVVPLRALA